MGTAFFADKAWLILGVGVLGGYLIGSISSAILISWIFRLPDPRLAGSKNPGTTNVLRLGGKLPAALTLLCDGLKGALPLMLAKSLTSNPWILSMILLAPIIGHLYPVFFHFKGGKGVATTLGGLLALSPVLGSIFIFMWIGIFALSGFSSLSALIAVLSMPAWAWGILDRGYVIVLVLLAALIVFKHRENIQRLLSGKESKLKLKK